MKTSHLKVGLAGTAVLVLLGGCATTSSNNSLAYYQVPCNTPGAVVAQPVAGGQAVNGALSEGKPDATGQTAAPPTCLIAVRNGAYGPVYRRPYYGSFGVGVGFGSHGGFGYGGGHGIIGLHGGGHRSGGHGGGGHHSGGHR